MSFGKMKFEDLARVFDAMFDAFYPHGIEEDEIFDNKLTSMFDIFCELGGWTTDEYWEEYEAQKDDEHECPECAKEAAALEASAEKDSKEKAN